MGRMSGMVNTINKLGALASQHLPTILGMAGTAMSIAAAVAAINTAPAAAEEIQEKEEEKGEDLSIVEKGTIIVKNCHAPITLTAGSIVCYWAAIGVSVKRLSALSALYLIEKTQSEEFKEATKTIVRPSEWEKINLQREETILKKNPVDLGRVQGDPLGEFLWYDDFSGRYFRASIAQVETAFATFNSKLYSREWMTLNDLYELFPRYEECSMGRYLGYDLVTMREKCSNPMDARVEMDYRDCRAASTGEPCYILKYTKPMALESWRNWDTYDNQFNYQGI